MGIDENPDDLTTTVDALIAISDPNDQTAEKLRRIRGKIENRVILNMASIATIQRCIDILQNVPCKYIRRVAPIPFCDHPDRDGRCIYGSGYDQCAQFARVHNGGKQ